MIKIIILVLSFLFLNCDTNVKVEDISDDAKAFDRFRIDYCRLNTDWYVLVTDTKTGKKYFQSYGNVRFEVKD